MIKNRDYHKDIEIDINNLEGEWIEQGSRYLYYAEALADAMDTRDRSKQNMEVVSARVDLLLRKSWNEKYPDLKMTEASIKSTILLDAHYKKALDLYNKAHHNVNLLAAAKSAFEHRKKALENLVSLHITGFHSSPKTPIQKQGGSIHREHTQKLNIKKRKLKKKAN